MPDSRGGARTDGRAGIDAGLVERLITAQFPQWADLPVRPVEFEGWDNRTYHLGDAMTVRLPTHESYVAAIEKEHRWLPLLSPGLPVPIPVSLAIGQPGEGYPYPWSIRGWIDGETAKPERIHDMPAFAVKVAEFVKALQRIGTTGGPAAGEHSFYRGAPPQHYDDETRRALRMLKGRIDTERAEQVWDAALESRFDGTPVWFHGDIAPGNLLVDKGELTAVIDFGTSGVGDPACDLVIAWGMFEGASRAAFREAVDHDEGAWARARGWVLWKALIGLAAIDGNQQPDAGNLRIVDSVIDERRIG